MKFINAIIPSKTKGEEEMNQLLCPKCEMEQRSKLGWAYPFKIECEGDFVLTGLVWCIQHRHEMPIEIMRGRITKLDTTLPESQSEKLSSSVKQDIKEDIKEAERAHYAQCYKACVAMCRRAVQLSLIEKGIKDRELSRMLSDALEKELLNQNTYQLATSVKGYGDIAMHRSEPIDANDASLVIHAAVRMLNEIFSK
jgi:hypothetical protein